MYRKNVQIVLLVVILIIFSCFSVYSISFDINDDGDFNISDVTTFQKHLIGCDVDINVTDVNNDDRININDATYMQRVLAGLVDETVKYKGTLIVNGTNVTAGEYIRFNEYDIDLPLLLISESLGCDVEWMDEETVNIVNNDKKYILTTANFTLKEEGGSHDFLTPAPDSTRRCEVLGKEVMIDRINIEAFLCELGASLKIDYKERIVYINS